MDFFRLFEKLFPKYHQENVAADTEETNNITRESSIDQCHSDIDINSNKLETEANVTVNSNEDFITSIESSVVSIEEFGVTKTLHYLETAVPLEISTNDDTFQEPKEDEISIIEDVRILNNAAGAMLVAKNTEDKAAKTLFPQYLQENVAADTEGNNNISRESSIVQCHSNIDSNSNKLENKANVTVNSNEDFITSIESSVVSIEEFGVTKTLHYLETAVPFEISTNDDTFQEPKENEISIIEDVRILNNAAGAMLVAKNTEDKAAITLFPQYLQENVAADTEGNNNISRESSIVQCHSNIDSNSNKLENKANVTVHSNKDIITSIDSPVVSIEEFGVTKTLHYLETVAPLEISTNDDIFQKPKEDELSLIEDVILNNAAGASLVTNVTEDGTAINIYNNNLEEIQFQRDANVSNNVNDGNTGNNVADDETIQSLEEFEAILNNIEKPFLNNEFGIEEINLDEFNDIFDEMDAVNEDLLSIHGSDKDVLENDDITTYNEKELTDLNNAINSNLEENIDIISINSSTEDEKSKSTVFINAVSGETDSDDGYNSSDFEFITETEANMAGILINYRLENYQNLSQTSSEPIIYCFNEDNRQENEESDPGEGPSRQNRPRNEFEDRSYRNDHHIPIGDDYLGLFEGIYNPVLPMSSILFLENKSVRTSAMNMQYDGIGFDKQLAMRRHQPDSSEDEFEDEAKESAKKILNMYPGANRKRRRRYL